MCVREIEREMTERQDNRERKTETGKVYTSEVRHTCENQIMTLLLILAFSSL